MAFDTAVGRIVTYLDGDVEGEKKVLAAIIVKVWSVDTVNLAVFYDQAPVQHYGDGQAKNVFNVTSCVRGEGSSQWLPYQERNIAVPN